MTSDEIPPGRASVAIATCAAARGADEDAPLLTEALEDLGVSVVERDWHDDTVEWGSYDLVVIRSTWDYMPRRDEFVAWARRVESLTRLANPATVVDWNTDKHYLSEMAAVGVPIVPTTFVEPSGSTNVTGPDQADPAGLADLILCSPSDGAGLDGFVVKPTISAGSKDTVRYPSPTADPTALESAALHVSSLLDAGRSAMVQPYMSRVDTDGETGLLYFDGRFSHAFRKGPLLRVGSAAVTGLFAPEEIDPREPSRAELDLAEWVLEACRALTGSELLYARVDLVPNSTGDPVLQELELTEPSFFLTTEPAAAGRAAAAIAAAIT